MAVPQMKVPMKVHQSASAGEWDGDDSERRAYRGRCWWEPNDPNPWCHQVRTAVPAV